MRIGVLGTMVWDTIDAPAGERVRRWGGITYSLAAAAAALPAGWIIRPIIRVGRDLEEEARAFLQAVPGLERPGGVVVVDEPNNRVHLRYHDREHRQETLTGGVGPWRWDELEPRLEGLDGLYVNFISGFELGLEEARRLPDAVPGLRYADLHSLLLDVAPDGTRVPRPLDRRDAWLGTLDVVQVNAGELALLAGGDDPATVARTAVRDGLRALLVTEGPRGARWFAPGEGAGAGAAEVASGRVPVGETPPTGDPTGCGDVWGATCFIALMRGERLEAAMAAANRAASRNVNHRGAEGLYGPLRNDS